jgi:glucose/arabinose dehydrogenase
MPDFDEGAVPMTPLKRLAAGAAVAALLASGAACTKDEPVAQATTAPPATSASPSPSVAVTPTPTPTPAPTLSQRAQAEADAIAMVKKYYAVDNSVLQSPVGSAKAQSRLEKVAIGTALIYAVSVVARIYSNSQRQTGDATVDHIVRESTNTTFRPSAKPPQIPTVAFRLCRDVSTVDLIGKDGKSAINPGRQDRVSTNVIVSNYSWPARDGWRVSSVTDEGKPC